MIISNGKTYENAEEMFNDWDKEFKMNHPISYWIDRTLFKGKGLFGYAPHHTLTHPNLIVEYIFDNLKWAWQRVFRGWDDRVIWSIDIHLSEMIPQWIDHLKENKKGIPALLFDKDDWDEISGAPVDGAEKKALDKYDKILDQISSGFRAYRRIQDESLWIESPEYPELKKKYDDAFQLLFEYFGVLGD